MTRAEVTRTLIHMERVREMSYEAETRREELKFIKEYAAMAKAIRPYLEGKIPYTPERSDA